MVRTTLRDPVVEVGAVLCNLPQQSLGPGRRRWLPLHPVDLQTGEVRGGGNERVVGTGREVRHAPALVSRTRCTRVWLA